MPAAERYLPIVTLATRSLHGFEQVAAGPIDQSIEAGIRVARAWRQTSPEGPTVMIDVAGPGTR